MDEERLSPPSSVESDDNENENENDVGQDNDNDNDNDNDADEVMEDVDDANEENNDDEEDEDEDNADGEGEAEATNDGEGQTDEKGEVEAEGDNDGDGDGDETAGETQGDNETAAELSEDKTINVRTDPIANGETIGETNGETNGETVNGGTKPKKKTPTPPPAPTPYTLRPQPRPETITARLYDIVPTMAAPQSTSVNAMAITPDLRYWITGGSDGYIRKYDGPNTINGKLALTVAQRHPFVDSVTKAGILMSYWENEEPATAVRTDQEHVLSPVYSLAVHSRALWLLSGLESGGINLQSVRHDEGKRICCLQQHSNAVSVLTLAQDEKSVLSGSWDKNILDWDLNTGLPKRNFEGSGGQISAIELRPASGAPIPEYADEPLPSTTMSTNNGVAPTNGVLANGSAEDDGMGDNPGADDPQPSPAHESLFGGSDAGSLFGETSGDNAFGHDDDDNFDADAMGSHDNEGGGMDHSADLAMTSVDGSKEQGTAATASATGGGDPMDLDVPAVQSEAAFPANHETSGNPSQTDQLQNETVNQADIDALKKGKSPMLVTNEAPQHHDPTQMSDTTFVSAAIEGTLRVWDKRVRDPVAKIGIRPGVPPWCMGACWSPDGNTIYAGRRNGTVEEFDIHKARRGWEPKRVLKFPQGSGAVSAVRPMVNGRHLVCASYDILRLYDLHDTRASKHSMVPFLIIPGPPRAGVISSLYIDPTSRFMLSTAGTRGWEGTSTEVLIGYEINVQGGG